MKGRPLTSRRGGALLTAVILAAAVGIIVAHILSTSMLEKELTVRSIARLQADNAAEMVVDYGLAEIAARFNENSGFAQDEFATGHKPLLLQDELLDHFPGLGVDTDSVFLAGGKVSEVVRYYVDPENPANTYDPHKGMNVLVRTVDLFGRATVIHPQFGNYTSYAKLKVQIRDAPIFSYAIFYNMDLEFHPGPAMTLTGNVHSNGTIWLCASSSLDFEGVLTAHEDIRPGFMWEGHQITWSHGVQNGDKVHFRNADGDWQSLYSGDGDIETLWSYYSSLSPDSMFTDLGYENWREYAINEFAGNLQSASHGIPLSLPSGVRPYVPDEDGSTEKENHGYSLIEPNLATTNLYHKGVAEREKFARKAGLIIRVHRDTDADGVDDDRGTALPAQAVCLRRRPEINDGWSTIAEVAWDPAQIIPYKTGYFLSFSMLRRQVQTDPMSALDLTKSTITIYDPDGNPINTTIDEVREVELALNPDFDFEQTDPDLWTPGDFMRLDFDKAFAAHPYMNENETGIDHNDDGDTNDWVDGMIDRRIALVDTSPTGTGRLDLVEINLGAFANIVNDADHTLFADYTPAQFYNGVVYVEIPTDSSVTPRSKDKVLRGVEKLGLILTQAGGSVKDYVPDPDYNKVPGRDEGFMLATNAPLYTRGHFNADGAFSGDPMSSDKANDPDPPVGLAADAITILSDNWRFEDSGGSTPPAVPTEFCAALLQGILPSNEGGRAIISGGNHNFPRLLENWGGLELRLRTSMVCAFESEIQTEPQGSHYGAPNRNWGYFDRFAAGVLPPGTPSYASYRKTAFEFLTADEFEAAIDAIPWSVTVPALP